MDVFHDEQPSHKSSHKKNNFWRHEHIQSLANNKRFNCMQHVVLGALVMLIENINLKVGATNGTIGIITKLEFNLKDNICNIFVAFNPSRYM